MKIAVCDDEKAIREQIRNLVEKQKNAVGACDCGDWQVEVYETGDALLEAGVIFDLVFLDIRMEGRNGIETAKALRGRKENMVLIFVSGIKDYVFEAFDVAAFHYLLKPVEEEKFAEVFERAAREVRKQKQRREEQIFIKTKKRNLVLKRNNILYVENRGRKVEIHTTGEVVELYAAMTELENRFKEGFYRCHRGYLVNMAHIAQYSGDSIHLDNGETVYLAKERYQGFVKEYMRYLRSGGTDRV